MLEEPWRITLLGRLSAEKPTGTIDRFRTRQTGALLARLALFPRRRHGREELADLLWPDDEPEAARAKLRIALSSLRRQLEPPGAGHGSVLQADRLAVRLNPAAVTTDVARFEAALARLSQARTAEERRGLRAQAAALYAGELLPGFYDDWIVDERERLEALADQALCHGDGGGGPLPPAAPPEDAAPDAPHVSLPPQWTRFFGRADEQARVRAWLAPPTGPEALGPEPGGGPGARLVTLTGPGGGPGARLVTLTGPGGVGKTRLSVEAARSVAASFPQGVFFLGLADVREADRLLPLVAARIAPSDTPHDDPARTIAERLGGGAALLVLDNLEQMADEIGPRVQGLLARSPGLRCLATSRRALNVPGERALPLSPLPTPGADSPPTLAVPSVALFVDRARSVRPDFGLSAGNADAVGRLCARLDGLPLALELAGAWIGVLTPAQMLTRLEGRAQPPASRRKDGPERHRTLWDAAAWSFDLLPPSLRRAWARLSVFRGGWTADAASAVCGDGDALEALSRLRDRSLILAEMADDGADVRFRMLESLREFAHDRLTPEERADASGRHAGFFRALAEDADDRYNGPEQAASLARLEADHENLRAAMDWCAADPGGGPDGLALAAALQRFWWLRGFFAEGRRRSALALGHPGAPQGGRPRVRTLSGVSVLANLQGDPDAAEASSLEALAILRATDQPVGMAVVLGGLGNIAKGRGDFDAARRYYAECLAGARASGADAVGATALVNLGNLALEAEDWDTARRHYTDGLALMRRLDNAQGVIVGLTNLAQLHCRTGDLPAAHAAAAECLTLCRDLGDRAGLAYAFEVRAQIARAECRDALSVTLYAAAASLRDALGTPLTDHERAPCDRDLAFLREALGPPAYAAAWDTGTALPLAAAVSRALCEETPA